LTSLTHACRPELQNPDDAGNKRIPRHPAQTVKTRRSPPLTIPLRLWLSHSTAAKSRNRLVHLLGSVEMARPP
jgi:hypothetical protein